MLLPMAGLLLTLLVVGAPATLAAAGDPRHARLAPYIGFTFLFAGLGALAFLIFLGPLGEAVGILFGTNVFGPLGLFSGYALGLVGGSLLGPAKASRRSRPSRLP